MDNPNESLTSEVGSPQPTVEMVNERWQKMFEQQNQNFLKIIQSISKPVTHDIVLPEFNPKTKSIDAKVWINMADMCIEGKELDTAQLLIMLNKALKEEASVWLSQVSFPTMKWNEFRVAFLARFDESETMAASLVRMMETKPKEHECYSSYATTFLTSLLSKWGSMTKEEIAVSFTLAHMSTFDSRIKRMAFTTEIRNRSQMQQQLSVIQYEPEFKKFRTTSPSSAVKCFLCGNYGHRVALCPERRQNINNGPPTSSRVMQQSQVICFKCNCQGCIVCGEFGVMIV